MRVGQDRKLLEHASIAEATDSQRADARPASYNVCRKLCYRHVKAVQIPLCRKLYIRFGSDGPIAKRPIAFLRRL